MLFLREDIADKLEAVDVAKFIDNERFGFITQETYDQLYYATYQYTVRGFDDFEQFQMFFDDDDRHVGVFVSLDQQPDSTITNRCTNTSRTSRPAIRSPKSRRKPNNSRCWESFARKKIGAFGLIRTATRRCRTVPRRCPSRRLRRRSPRSHRGPARSRSSRSAPTRPPRESGGYPRVRPGRACQL
jgi:hypothetical protein